MAAKQKLYTLTEVSKVTGISMPTLQRYKKLYQDRIPSEGEGRKQRYPRRALKVFEELREENLKKRGRPAKKTAAKKTSAKKRAAKKTGAKKKTAAKKKTTTKKKTAKQKTAKKKTAKKKTVKKRPTKKKAAKKTTSRKAASKKTAAKKKAGRAKSGSKRRAKKAPAKRRAAGGDQELLTLLEIGRRTGISYPTLLRYVKVYGDEIPSVGEGRRRRFPVAAVKEFRRLRRASKRGPRAGKKSRSKSKAKSSARRAAGTDEALKARVRELEKAQQQVTRQLDEIVRLLKQPMRITVRSD